MLLLARESLNWSSLWYKGSRSVLSEGGDGLGGKALEVRVPGFLPYFLGKSLSPLLCLSFLSCKMKGTGLEFLQTGRQYT